MNWRWPSMSAGRLIAFERDVKWLHQIVLTFKFTNMYWNHVEGETKRERRQRRREKIIIWERNWIESNSGCETIESVFVYVYLLLCSMLLLFIEAVFFRCLLYERMWSKKGGPPLVPFESVPSKQNIGEKRTCNKNRTERTLFFPFGTHNVKQFFFSLHRPFDEHAQINKKSTSNTAEALKSPAKISVYSNFVYFHCCHFHWWIV